MTATIAESALKVHQQKLLSPTSTNPHQLKYVAFEYPDTVDAGDILQITLANYGLTTVWDAMIYTHTATDSVIVTAANELTTSYSTSTVFKTAVPGGSDNDKRVLILVGE